MLDIAVGEETISWVETRTDSTHQVAARAVIWLDGGPAYDVDLIVLLSRRTSGLGGDDLCSRRTPMPPSTSISDGPDQEAT